MTYKLPDVWTWDDENENVSGNRPTAGARFDQVLPKGDAPFQLYSLGTPNGIKVTVMFEELKELKIKDADYDLFLINIGEGDQFGSDFVELNPNSKIPALLDTSVNPALRIFESVSILLYLAEKFDVLLPTDLHQRTEVFNWLFWQTGATPFVGGGFGHFFHFAPEKIKYAVDRFAMETKRQLDLLDKLLAKQSYIVGDEYTIADIAIWPWYGRLVRDELYANSAKFLNVTEYPNLIAWANRIAERPGVQRGLNAQYRSIK